MSSREQFGSALRIGLVLSASLLATPVFARQDSGTPATMPTTQADQTPAPAPEAEPATAPAEAQPAPAPASAPAPTTPSVPIEQSPPGPALGPEEQAAQAALAERFVQMSKMVLQRKAVTPVMLQENAVLLAAAVRANPNEPRLFRLLIESRLESKDAEGAKVALKEYLDLLRANGQGDHVAAVKLIDLHASDMETAEKKVEYLKNLAGADGLAAEIRSHAAVRLAQAYLDRGQQAEAEAAIDIAVKLNPLNSVAQRVRYENKHAAAAPAERVSMLLGILRANPAQPEVMSQIAHELSDVGVLDQALQWYQMSFTVSQRLGRGLGTAEDFTDYTAALLAAGQPRDAGESTNKLLDTDAGNADAAFVKLMSEKRLGDPERITTAKTGAETAVLRRLDDLHARLTQAQPAATTQPADAVADQSLADVQKLKDPASGTDPALYSAYVAGLARAAWCEIYFIENPQAATKFIDALRSLLPEGDVLVARLEGWSFLAQGKADEAKVKLSAVADRDALSKFGMIRLNEKEAGADATTSELLRLAGENASGVVGAMLVEAVRDRGARFVPGPNAAPVRAELDKFPKQFLSILDMNSVGSFYKIVAEPTKVAHKFGEPIIARVTIQNVGDYDLSLGPDGTIKPDLWFGVKIQGMDAKSLPFATYDRMGQQLVLKAHGGSASQMVRVDDGPLAIELMRNPVVAMALMFNVFTNPVPVETGISPGPGGQRAQFTRVVDRAGSPIAQPQFVQMILAPLMGGTAAERIRTAEVAGTFVMVLSSEGQPAELKPVADMFYTSLERAAAGNDPSPAARAWLDYELAMISKEPRRSKILTSLLKGDAWIERFLGLCLSASINLPPAKQKEIADKILENESDPLVKSLASAIVQAADEAAAQAATQPTTAPSEPGQAQPPAIPDTGGFNLNPTSPLPTPTTPPPPSGGGGGGGGGN